MPNLLSIPVSAVESTWIASDLYPSLERARANLPLGGVIWLGTDSSREGNYLLQRIRVFAQERCIPCEGLLVSEHDPYTFWDDVVGTGDDSAKLWRFAPSTLVCVENGFELPMAFVRDRYAFLDTYARAHSLILIIPVTHTLRKDLEKTCLIAAPPFAEVPEGRRRELACALLADAFPNDGADRRNGLARDLVAARPVSRVELEAWIDHFAGSDAEGSQPWRIPPRIPRQRATPSDVPTKAELGARLMASMARLREANVAFSTWRGHLLIREIRHPPDPFYARDPIHWFSGSISYLSCYFFDAVDDSFPPLLGWRWNDASGEIEAAEALPFVDILRTLRTVMQHGLNGQHPRNIDTLDVVERWCRAAAGSPIPQRDRCRILTSRLLRELEETVIRLSSVVTRAMESSNRDLIERQLDLALRRLPKYRWFEILSAVCDEFAVELDIDGILDLHITDLQDKIRKAPEKGGSLEERAHELASDVIVKVLARCPVTSNDLIAVGVPRGPLLGKVKAFAEERWRTDATVSKDELLRLAGEYLRGVNPSVAPNQDPIS